MLKPRIKYINFNVFLIFWNFASEQKIPYQISKHIGAHLLLHNAKKLTKIHVFTLLCEYFYLVVVMMSMIKLLISR